MVLVGIGSGSPHDVRTAVLAAVGVVKSPSLKKLLVCFAAPALEEAVRAVVLAVNVDEPEDSVRAFLTEFGATELTVLLDPDLAAYDAYGVNRLPVTFVVDPSGGVRDAHVGELTLDALNAYRDDLAPA